MAKKVPTEQETRQRLIDWARQYGCEAELLKIFARYDDLLKGCKTETERKAIQTMGIIEIDNFYNGGYSSGELTIDGKRIR